MVDRNWKATMKYSSHQIHHQSLNTAIGTRPTSNMTMLLSHGETTSKLSPPPPYSFLDSHHASQHEQSTTTTQRTDYQVLTSTSNQPLPPDPKTANSSASLSDTSVESSFATFHSALPMPPIAWNGIIGCDAERRDGYAHGTSTEFESGVIIT